MGPISWSVCCAFKWNGGPSLHPSVSQCHATVWWGWLTGRLHFGVSRKRILDRKLSNVKSRGVVTQRARSPNFQKEHSTSVEKGVLIFAWSLPPRSKLGWRRPVWGATNWPVHLLTISAISATPPSTLATILEYGFMDPIIHQGAFLLFTSTENVLGSLLQLPWLFWTYSFVFILLKSLESDIRHGHTYFILFLIITQFGSVIRRHFKQTRKI